MNKFQLTPRKLLFGVLVIVALLVTVLVISVFSTMSKKEQINIQNDAAASTPATVEILTPGGNRIITAQAVPASPQATPSAASDTAASEPENEAASEAEQAAAATTRPSQRRQRNNQASTEESTNSATATTSNNRSAATATETPVEPVNRQPARAAEQPAPAPQPAAPAKKKEVMDNLF